ncbi:MAG: hypothetical protein R3C18_08295 [Planctomycetaceae bacterium]
MTNSTATDSDRTTYRIKDAADLIERVAKSVQQLFKSKGFASQMLEGAGIEQQGNFSAEYVLQISSEGTVGAATGTNLSATLALGTNGTHLLYQVYGASWLDKAAVAGVGLFLGAGLPLLTASYGAIRQAGVLKELQDAVPATVERLRLAEKQQHEAKRFHQLETIDELSPGEWWDRIPEVLKQSFQQQLGLSATSTHDDLASVKTYTFPLNHHVVSLGAFKWFTNLESLTIPFVGPLCTHVISTLEHLAACKKLKQLVIPGTSVGNLRHLGGLSSLEELDIRSTKSTVEPSLEPLMQLTSLKLVDVRGCKVSKADIRAFKTANPNCTIRHDYWFI